jgi:hypothetical protein
MRQDVAGLGQDAQKSARTFWIDAAAGPMFEHP